MLHHFYRKENDFFINITEKEHATFALTYNACKRFYRNLNSDSLTLLNYYDLPFIANEADKAALNDKYNIKRFKL
jgi:hypothetical protein